MKTWRLGLPGRASVKGLAGVAAACALWGAATPASGSSFWGREPDAMGQIQFFANMVTEPDSIWSWDGNTITYRLDTAFRTAFPDTRIHDQIRLAIDQWDDANGTAQGTQDSYFRSTGAQPFGDIRSIMVHELGHVMGFGHPNQADDSTRNYDPDGGGGWTPVGASGLEVMNSFINPGRYNHILSWDELNAYDFAYGSNINFVEVGETDASADITITTYTNVPTNWAQGPPTGQARDPMDPTQGSEIISGVIRWNTNSADPLGFRTLGINWDYQNASGMDVKSFEVRTRGTNNPTPLFHYDNNGFPHPFGTYTNSPVGANSKDDLLHVWSDPAGGVVPFPEILHVGLEQDVWDWTVVSAETVAPDGTRAAAPLLSFHDWNNTIVGSPSTAEGDGIFSGPEETVVARGFRIAAPDVLAEVSDLWIGPVTGLGLKLEDLTRRTFEELSESGDLVQIREFEPMLMQGPPADDNPDRAADAVSDGVRLEGFEDFFIVLEGEQEDLPDDILRNGNFLIPEGLARFEPDDELFVAAVSRSEEAEVMTFALLGAPLIGFNPDVLKGDFDGNGVITGEDIGPFVLALTSPGEYEEKFGVPVELVGDLNGDLTLSGLDIGNFVSLLTGEWPPDPGLVSAFPNIPEPAGIVSLALGAGVLMNRRRRAA